MLTTTPLALLIGAALAPISPAEAVVVDVVDGDTIEVTIAGDIEQVRLIGIDAPETGTCEADIAGNALDELLADGVSLVGGAARDRDGYGRLLRYVQIAVDPADDTDGYPDGTLDVGAALVAEGYAIARYDSRDGYGAHDRQQAYWDLDSLSDPSACTPEQSAVHTAEQAQIEQAQTGQAQGDEVQGEQAQAGSATASNPTYPAPPQPASAVTIPAVNPPTIDAPAVPMPTAPVVVVPPPDGNDNPYDDGGPRNPDGSCPPGGCWPGT